MTSKPSADAPLAPWSRGNRWRWVAAASVAVLVVLYLGASYVVVSASLKTERIVPDETPLDSGLAVEAVTIESDVDRIPLAGWLLQGRGERAIVMLHGLGCHSWSGSQPDIVRAYIDAGFHVLVFDLRAHGRSGGELLGLGWHERRDVRAAVNVLLERGFEPQSIGLHGGSYGAATALLSAAVIPEIGAVMADSAFADMRPLMIREIVNRTGIPAWLAKVLEPGIGVTARLFFSLDLGVISPERAVPKIAPRPILFIHGSKDETIPIEHAHRLMASSINPADQLWTLEGMRHTEGVRLESDGCEETEVSPMRDAYLKKVTAFFHGALQ